MGKQHAVTIIVVVLAVGVAVYLFFYLRPAMTAVTPNMNTQVNTMSTSGDYMPLQDDSMTADEKVIDENATPIPQ